MYKYAISQSLFEEDRVCLSCNEEYIANITDLNKGTCPNCFSYDTDIIE